MLHRHETDITDRFWKKNLVSTTRKDCSLWLRGARRQDERASKQASSCASFKKQRRGPHRFPEMERGQKDQPGTAELRGGGQRSLQRGSREDLREDKAEEPWRKSHPGKHSNCFGFDHVASKMATPSFWGACSFLHCARSEHASFSAFLAHSRLKKIMKQQFERKRWPAGCRKLGRGRRRAGKRPKAADRQAVWVRLVTHWTNSGQ